MLLGHNLGVDETPLSDDEFKELHGILQQAALAAYPNPERKGCPGAEVLMEIAHTAWPANHPGYDHVKHCSPCLREMLDMRRETILARTRRRYRMYRIAIAAVLVLAAGIGIILWSGIIHHQEGSAQQAVIARWDLQNASAMRDLDDYQQPVHLEAPAKKGTIAVVLPLGSEPGEYEVEVKRYRNSRAIKKFKSTASLSNEGKTVLQINADLSDLRTGHYVVAFRRGQQAWHFAQLHIG
jgi:hypothetical protein